MNNLTEFARPCSTPVPKLPAARLPSIRVLTCRLCVLLFPLVLASTLLSGPVASHASEYVVSVNNSPDLAKNDPENQTLSEDSASEPSVDGTAGLADSIAKDNVNNDVERDVKREVKKDVKKDVAAELSVAPLGHLEYPDDRPAWLGELPTIDFLDRDVDSPEHHWVVVSTASETIEQSERDLRLMQRAAVSTYIQSLTQSDRRFDFPISDQWIDACVSQSYFGKVFQGDEQLYQHATRLTFDAATQAEIRTAWKTDEVRDRLSVLGIFVAGSFCCFVLGGAVTGLLSRRRPKSPSASM